MKKMIKNEFCFENTGHLQHPTPISLTHMQRARQLRTLLKTLEENIIDKRKNRDPKEQEIQIETVEEDFTTHTSFIV